MKIYTKTGDKGFTSLIGGRRVYKSDIQIEAYGTIDELNAYIGLINDNTQDQSDKEILLLIQNDLFVIGAYLASDFSKDTHRLPKFEKDRVDFLEYHIDTIEATLNPLRSFILPGGHTQVSYCHIARCVCRRAERMIIAGNLDLDTLKNTEWIKQYINRLSDFLFVWARKLSKALSVEEIPWVPKY